MKAFTAPTVHPSSTHGFYNLFALLAAWLITFSLSTLPTFAAPDTVDTQFAGSAGQVFDKTVYGGVASTLVQPDGKILFGSNEMAATVAATSLKIPLIRFNPDGTVDHVFFADNDPDGKGTGIYYDGAGWPEVHALGMQSDGKIIAAGVMQGMRDGINSFVSNSIVRINANGTVDMSFQTGGTAPWPTGGLNYIEDVSVTAMDQIYCVGGFSGMYDTGGTINNNKYGIARLNADGSLDAGFQINPLEFGVPSGALSKRGLFAQAAPDASGGVYVVGYFEWGPAFPVSGHINVFARLNADGSRDFSFNPQVPANVERVTGVVVEPSGNVVAMGSIGNPATDGYMARFTPTGAVDGSFSLASGLGVINARPLERDPNGRYLLARSSGASASYDVLLRIESDGSLDTSFNATATYTGGPNSNAFFSSFTTGANGKIYSGSWFDDVNGVPTIKLVAFEGDFVANAPGSIQFAAHAFTVNEEDGTVTIPITRTGGSTGAASASFSMVDINTTAGADYTAVAVTVNFAAGVGGTQYVTIPIATDGIIESVEVATLNLTSITGASAGSQTSANLTIVDSDSPPLIVLQPTAIFVPPLDSFSLVVGVLSGKTPVTYQWKKGGVDIPGATLPIYLVTSANAAAHNGSYTVVVTNANGSVTSSAVDVVVKDPAQLSFSAADFEALESDGTATLTLSRSGSSVGAVSVDVVLTDSSATMGADYTYTTQTVAWADGDSADKTVTVTLIDDSDVESPETVVASLSNFSLDAVVGITAAATLTILDDDSPINITTPLKSVRAVEGWNATLSVTAESQSPMTYQWFRDGVIVVGQTSATLIINPMSGADTGLYSVQITNAAGTVTSGPVELGLRPNPLDQQVVLGSNGNGITYAPISRAAGGYYIPGSFSSWNTPSGTIAAQRLVRILANGTPDSTFLPVINSGVNEVAEMSDGSLIIRGSFSTVGGASSAQIGKLNADGTVNTIFAGNVGSSYVNGRTLLVDENDKILFSHIAGLSRLDANGVADAAFTNNVAALFTSATYSKLALAPGGGYYLSGTFDLAGLPSGNTRRNLLRIAADGTLDNTFTPTTGIYFFGVQSDAKVIIGSSTLTRLNADGSVDASFSAIPLVTSQAYAVAADDSLYVSVYENFIYQLRHYDKDGHLDTTFNSGNNVVSNGPIQDIVALRNGNLYLGGSFSVLNGQSITMRPVIIAGEISTQSIVTQPVLTIVDPGVTAGLSVVVSSTQPVTYQWRRNGVALIDGGDISGATTANLSIANSEGLDEGSYEVVITNSLTGESVTSAAVNLVVLGAPEIVTHPADQTLIIGQSIALSMETYALAPYTVQWWKIGVGALSGETAETLNIAVATASDSGRYYAVVTNALGSATTNEAIVQVIADPAGLVAGFIPATSGANGVNAISPDASGGALLTGSFFNITHSSGNGPSYFARVDATGAPIQSPEFTGTSNQSITLSAVDSTGGFILSGTNFFLNGSNGHYLERVDAAGLTDASFTTNRGAYTSNTASLAIDSSGRIYAGGANFIKRFAADGTPDTAYTPTPTAQVRNIVFAGDGKLYAQTSNGIFRFNTDGTQDTTFTLDAGVASTNISGLGVAEDGSVTIGSNNDLKIYILESNGTIRNSFPIPSMTYGNIRALAVQANGKVLVGYDQGKRLIRLLTDGTEDPMFDVGTGINSSITDIDVYEDGSIWVAGSFTSYNSTTAYGYIKLNGDPLDLNINIQPQDQIVDIGQTATFTITATSLGAEPISYQWKKGGVDLSNGGDISGADTNTLMISNTDLTDVDDYAVVITNDTTSTEKTSLSATLTVLEAPKILADLDPTSDLEVGETLALSLSVQGAGALNYQWQKDGVDLAGETGQSLDITPLTLADAGDYQVVISNVYGSVTSAATTVSVTLSPAAIASDSTDFLMNNAVRAILPLPDGRTLIGGKFSYITNNGSNVSIDEIALINADGTLDTSFDLGPNGTVYSLTLDTDGGVLVGGRFTSIGGQSHQRVARLNPNLTMDASFNTSAGANSDVWDVAVTPDGKIYIGGSFTTYGGDNTSPYLCRLNRDGSLDTSFAITGLNIVYQVVPTADDKIVAGGAFSLVGNRYIARFNSDGSHDTSFTANTTNVRYVYALVQTPDGGWLAGTRFGNLFRFDADGVQDNTWPTQANNDVWSLAIEEDGQIVVGGNFTTIGGQSINRIARLNSNGTIDPSFTMRDGTNAVVYALGVQPLGKIWIGGGFSTYRGVTAGKLALLNGDPLDLAIVQNPSEVVIEPGQTAQFSVVAKATDTILYQWQRNGINLIDGGDISGATTDTLSLANVTNADEDNYQVVVTHSVTSASKTSEAKQLVVLGAPEILTQPEAVSTEAGLDAVFSVLARGISPMTYQWYIDGSPLSESSDVSGTATDTLSLSNLQVANSGQVSVKVTNGLGNIDSSTAELLVEKFAAGLDHSVVLPVSVSSTIYDVLPFDDGSYIIGGQFASIGYNGGSASRRSLAKFNADGSADLTFPQINGGGTVYAIEKSPDGKIYVAGGFGSFKFSSTVITSKRIIRLNADGTHDATFNPGVGPNNNVKIIRPLDNGKVFIAGDFASISDADGIVAGTAYMALLNTDGTVDTTFVSQSTSTIRDLGVSPDGSIWIALSHFWGAQRYIVHIDMTGAPVSGFSYTGNMTSYSTIPTSDGGVLSFSYSTSPYEQKITPSGGIDAGWASGGTANRRIFKAADVGGGRTIIAGDFSTYAGVSRTKLAVIQSNGALNMDFDPHAGFNGIPQSMRIDSLGRIWCVGSMTTYQGNTIPRMVVLNGFPPLDPIQQYLTDAGVPANQQGDADDPDGDGFANIIEYLYGSSPNQPSGGLGVYWNPINSTLSGAQVNSIDAGSGTDPAKSYRVVYIRIPTDRKGLSVGLEAGLNLNDFGTGAQTHLLGAPTSDGPDHQIQAYYITPSMTDTPRLFWRMSVGR